MQWFAKRALSFGTFILAFWVLNFLLVTLAPGDATNLYFDPETGKGTIETIQRQRGLDQPWLSQFFFWTGRFLVGDLGYSWTRHQPVSEVLLRALPATLQLTLCALLFNLVVGTAWGMVAGIRTRRMSGYLLDGAGIVLHAVPTFWISSILVLLFGLKLGLLPVAGENSPGAEQGGMLWFLTDRLQHLVLPVAALGIAGAAATARLVKSRVVEVMQTDYMRRAVASGIPRSRILLRHALPNALLPVMTLVGLHFPFLIGGSFVVEVIFAWPGMGRVMYESFLSRDYPVVLAANLLVAIMAVLGASVTDILCRTVDPRLRYR